MITRRQALYFAGGLLPALGGGGLSGCVTRTNNAEGHVWVGEALGAPASIRLVGACDDLAQNAFALAQKVINQMSQRFSLYDPNSEISRLNRHGALPAASSDFISLLRTAKEIGVLTQGAFDITVQVLWNAAQDIQIENLSSQHADQVLADARALLGFDKVHVEGQRVWFATPGMAITLNGIAQGYITEQVATALAGLGDYSGLVNIGEFQAFGPKRFTLGIADPTNVLDVIETVHLSRAALATSSSKGGYISETLSHIFSPSGQVPSFISASVVHPSATMADGLATAFTLMELAAIKKAVKNSGAQKVLLVRASGDLIRI
jgi:thiamine biosynthesis lipoprotein